MKKLFFIVFMLSGVCTVYAQHPNNIANDITKLFEFKNDQYDFGKIPYGKPVQYDVLIKNIGTDSASLDNVQVGCGCTTPKYEKGKKFAPGETIIVTLGFSGNAIGNFSKSATLFFNNGTVSKSLNFKGETYTGNSNTPTTNSSAQPNQKNPLPGN